MKFHKCGSVLSLLAVVNKKTNPSMCLGNSMDMNIWVSTSRNVQRLS